MENDDNILFTAYIEKSMTEIELESFENRVKTDRAFAESFEEFKEIYQVLENQFSSERETFIKSVRKADSEYKLKSNSKSSSGRVFPFKPWQIGIAATILLVIGFYFFSNIGQPSYHEYANPGEIVLTVRSESQTDFKNAEASYNSRDYNKAISYFNILLEKSPENVEVQFYKAIALIETDQFEKANSLLKSISEGNSAYAHKAIYWRALNMLKHNKLQEAKTILQEIPSNSPEYPMANKLLSKL